MLVFLNICGSMYNFGFNKRLLYEDEQQHGNRFLTLTNVKWYTVYRKERHV